MYLGEGKGSSSCIHREIGKFIYEFTGPCNYVHREEMVRNRRIDHKKYYFGTIYVYLCVCVYFFIFCIFTLFSIIILRNT